MNIPALVHSDGEHMKMLGPICYTHPTLVYQKLTLVLQSDFPCSMRVCFLCMQCLEYLDSQYFSVYDCGDNMKYNTGVTLSI